MLANPDDANDINPVLIPVPDDNIAVLLTADINIVPCESKIMCLVDCNNILCPLFDCKYTPVSVTPDIFAIFWNPNDNNDTNPVLSAVPVDCNMELVMPDMNTVVVASRIILLLDWNNILCALFVCKYTPVSKIPDIFETFWNPNDEISIHPVPIVVPVADNIMQLVTDVVIPLTHAINVPVAFNIIFLDDDNVMSCEFNDVNNMPGSDGEHRVEIFENPVDIRFIVPVSTNVLFVIKDMVPVVDVDVIDEHVTVNEFDAVIIVSVVNKCV